MFSNLSLFILPAVVEYLSSTIKNKDSERAKRLYSIVYQLNAVTAQFLASFDQKGNFTKLPQRLLNA